MIKHPARPGRRFPFIVLMLGWALFLIAAPVPAANDWFQWRGPERTGISAETGLLPAWPAGGPSRLWEIDGLGQGDGGPVTQGPRLFIQGTRGNDSLLFCRDRETGAAVWETRLDRKYRNGNNPGPSSTPTIDGDRIYALTGYGVLACIRINDGVPLWTLDLVKDLKGKCGNWGYSESPLIEGDSLIVAPGGSGGTIVALNKTTGETIWTSTGLKEPCAYTSAIAMDLGAIRAIVHFTSTAGVGLDASTGKLLWRYAPPANGTANASTPVVHGNRVFYSSAYGTGGGLLELAPVNDRVLTRQVYFTKKMQNHFGGVVFVDGYLYGSSGNILTCMDFDTGKVAWQDRSIGKSSVTFAEGLLYLVSENGRVALVPATPDGYNPVGEFMLESPTTSTRTVPVVTDGRMLIRNGARLVCYDIRDRTS